MGSVLSGADVNACLLLHSRATRSRLEEIVGTLLLARFSITKLPQAPELLRFVAEAMERVNSVADAHPTMTAEELSDRTLEPTVQDMIERGLNAPMHAVVVAVLSGIMSGAGIPPDRETADTLRALADLYELRALRTAVQK